MYNNPFWDRALQVAKITKPTVYIAENICELLVRTATTTSTHDLPTTNDDDLEYNMIQRLNVAIAKLKKSDGSMRIKNTATVNNLFLEEEKYDISATDSNSDFEFHRVYSDKYTIDAPRCRDCQIARLDPAPDELFIWLHAFRYTLLENPVIVQENDEDSAPNPYKTKRVYSTDQWPAWTLPFRDAFHTTKFFDDSTDVAALLKYKS
jgi:hypothetical protein